MVKRKELDKMEPNKKSPIYNSLFFWLIILVIALGIAGFILGK